MPKLKDNEGKKRGDEGVQVLQKDSRVSVAIGVLRKFRESSMRLFCDGKCDERSRSLAIHT